MQQGSRCNEDEDATWIKMQRGSRFTRLTSLNMKNAESALFTMSSSSSVWLCFASHISRGELFKYKFYSSQSFLEICQVKVSPNSVPAAFKCVSQVAPQFVSLNVARPPLFPLENVAHPPFAHFSQSKLVTDKAGGQLNPFSDGSEGKTTQICLMSEVSKLITMT